jgi:membrane fusion protein (multidrug efflux system)
MYRFHVLIAILCTAGCSHHEHKEEQGKLPVTTPMRKSIEITREYVGQIRAIQHIELRALERGYLQQIMVDEGQTVQRGAKMFQIMPLIYQAEVEKSAAEAERAELEYNNTKALFDKNVVSAQEVALAKANLSKERAQLSLATTHKGLTEIRAPFSGIMGRFQARLGSLIGEGDLLTTLSDNTTVWVYFNVAEAEYLKFKSEPESKDRPVKLIMANGEIFDQPGKVQTIEADFDNETGTIAFRAGFPNPKGLLRHGQTGKVQMTSVLENALIIPQKATFEVLDKKFVFVVDEKNAVHTRPITVSVEQHNLFAVASGLAEGDKILLDGLRKVREGDVIEAAFEKPADVLAHLEVAAE